MWVSIGYFSSSVLIFILHCNILSFCFLRRRLVLSLYIRLDPIDKTHQGVGALFGGFLFGNSVYHYGLMPKNPPNVRFYSVLDVFTKIKGL